MSIPYILFYSLGCQNSKNLANILQNHPMRDDISNFCVDGHLHHLPEYITAVPTLRINTPNEKTLLIGTQILDWLQFNKEQIENEMKNMENDLNQDKNIVDYDEAFSSQKKKSNMDDIWKTTSNMGENFDPRASIPTSGNKLNDNDIEDRMRQMKSERGI